MASRDGQVFIIIILQAGMPAVKRRVWHQQETKAQVLLLCELDSTAENASTTTNDPGRGTSVFSSSAERAR